MSELTPKQAATIAEEIYTVQNEFQFKNFLTNPLFAQTKNTKTQLNANIGGRLIRQAKDGFGLCTMGRKQYEGDAFFIFRGTTTAHNKADFVSDARIGTQMSKTGTIVHIGFNEIFKSMLDDIRAFVDDHKKQITGIIHCVGHSLGGAVATLAADWLKSKTGQTVKLYTFGQPRVGLTAFSSKLTAQLTAGNIHRVFHSTDPVPMIPIFPYIHSPTPGNGHFIHSDSLVMSGEAHKMKSYIRSVKNETWLAIKRQPPIFNHERAIKEWLTSKIRPDAEHPRTWEWLDAALIFILKKIGGALFTRIHTAIIGVHTLADRIAWILSKGIDLAENISYFVRLFINKVMQILRMPVVGVNQQSITRTFLTNLLTRLIHQAHELAKKAIRGM